MSASLVVIGLLFTAAVLSLLPRVHGIALRACVVLGALAVALAFTFAASYRNVPDGYVGVVVKNAFAAPLPQGRVLATNGEMGAQAKVLMPGWHSGLWPFLFSVEQHPWVEIDPDEVGLLATTDGNALPIGDAFAPAWSESETAAMLDASHFLTNGGFKGPQTTVLRPGKHPLNPKLYRVTVAPVTNIPRAVVGVVKSNVGPEPATGSADEKGLLVPKGSRGIWNTPYGPQRLYLHTKAYELAMVSTATRVVAFTDDGSQRQGSLMQSGFSQQQSLSTLAEEAMNQRQSSKRLRRAPELERAHEPTRQALLSGASLPPDINEITVRSSDGFTFPVDVRVEFHVLPKDAPTLIASLGNDHDALFTVLNATVRATFRNNAERVKALDYVQQRSEQEKASLEMIATKMADVGVTVTAVQIGNVGDDRSLGSLLKTQTDRELAKQQQVTLQEQQLAAEQQKALSRTEQEATEERRLATAQYQVKIAEEQKQQAIITAQASAEQTVIAARAQAEQITLEADAQAGAYKRIAAELGSRSTTMLESLRIVGANGINITPRIMLSGSGSPGSTTDAAFIGAVLDTMLRDDDTGELQSPSLKAD